MEGGRFGPIYRFISQTIQNTASYNVRRKGTRMRSIECCYFQWFWVNLNL